MGKHARLVGLCRGFAIGGVGGRLYVEEFADLRDVGGPIAVGEQSIMSDAVKTLRVHMEEEAADELGDVEGHGFVATGPVDAIVLAIEGDGIVLESDQAAIGDRDTVGVAREISEHRFGPGKWALGVDHPLDLAHRCQIGRKRARLGQPGMLAEEL